MDARLATFSTVTPRLVLGVQATCQDAQGRIPVPHPRLDPKDKLGMTAVGVEAPVRTVAALNLLDSIAARAAAAKLRRPTRRLWGCRLWPGVQGGAGR